MNAALIERLAREAGFRIVPQAAPGVNWIYTGSATGRCSEALERFATLVAEECAKTCIEHFEREMRYERTSSAMSASDCAAAIREMFKDRGT